MSLAVVMVIFSISLSLVFGYRLIASKTLTCVNQSLPFSVLNLSHRQVQGIQRNILIVGVDHLSLPKPNLVSIWLVLYFPNLPHLTFIPIYPQATIAGLDTSQSLSQRFDLNPDKTLDPSFTAVLENLGYWWNNYILIDALSLAEIIDQSGAGLADSSLRGIQAVAGSLSTGANSESSMLRQRDLIAWGCVQLGTLSQGSILKNLEAINKHIVTDLSAWQLKRESQFLTRSPEEISCEFPTIRESLSFHGGQIGYP